MKSDPRHLQFRKPRLRTIAGFVIAVLGLVFTAGPRVAVDTTVHYPSLPKNLDSYLATREQRFGDITPGTEKKIIWAEGPGARREYAVVYIHGFSATHRETAPLAERLAERLRANLFLARLTGHGRSGAAMLDGSVNAWLNDTVKAFEIGKRLGGKVIMLGVSTGGTAVTWLAVQPETEALAACILISPNFAPADGKTRVLLWPWGRQIAEIFIGRERQWTGENPGHERYWTTRYPTAALLPMMGMVKLVDTLDLGVVRAPVLVIYSPDDQVVAPQATVSAFSAMGSARKQIIPFRLSQDPSQHVLAGDILSPRTTATMVSMISDFVVPVK